MTGPRITHDLTLRSFGMRLQTLLTDSPKYVGHFGFGCTRDDRQHDWNLSGPAMRELAARLLEYADKINQANKQFEPEG